MSLGPPIGGGYRAPAERPVGFVAVVGLRAIQVLERRSLGRSGDGAAAVTWPFAYGLKRS